MNALAFCVGFATFAGLVGGYCLWHDIGRAIQRWQLLQDLNATRPRSGLYRDVSARNRLGED